jgi:hypothetical protein
MGEGVGAFAFVAPKGFFLLLFVLQLFGFQIIWLLSYLMNCIPETRHAYEISTFLLHF